jgi:hypothetical protein
VSCLIGKECSRAETLRRRVEKLMELQSGSL